MKQMVMALMIGLLWWGAFSLEEAGAQSKGKGYNKEMVDIADELGLSKKDLNKFLETKGGGESKTAPNPGAKYNFANLNGWLTAGISLLGLGLFFYFVRKKF